MSGYIDFEVLKTQYSKLDQYQSELADQIRNKKLQGRFLLAEVEEVITLGRRSKPLSQVSLPQYSTDRGGLETYHGPGQWVLFPVFPMERGVKQFCEKALLGTLNLVKRFDPGAFTDKGDRVGVWLSDRTKVASMGIRIRNHVVQHGLSLNVFPTKLSFLGINPCGIQGAQPGFLLREPQTPERLSQRVHEEFLKIGHDWVQSVSRSLFGKPAKEISA